MFLLSLVPNAWTCAMLLTTDQGVLATSAAQQVILEANGAGTQTRYQIEYTGDAAAFGWLIVVHGSVGEGDVTEADASEFDALRSQSQPRLVSTSFSGGGAQICGCAGAEKSAGGGFTATDELAVDVTAEGFAGPFAYQVLSAETGDALDAWLTEAGFQLGETAGTIDDYVAQGEYSFVAVSLTPDVAETTEGGRQLPALAIQSDSTSLQFPARMAATSMAERQRTIVYVVGDATAEVSGGWDMIENTWIDGGDDPMTAFDDELLAAGSAATPAYLRVYSGELPSGWLTRFETWAPRAVHVVDPEFDFIEYQYTINTEIEIPGSDTAAGAWLVFPILALGWGRRRRSGG